MKTTPLAIDLLRLDGDTQSRVRICPDTVDDYAELIESNGSWPLGPLDVFHDGSDYWVADGFHRTLAGQQAKRASLPCRIHKGTVRDARIFAMTANDKHGLRMTREDKRACVEWLLDTFPRMTQREVATKAGVSARTVQYIVADRKPQIANSPPPQQGKNQDSGGDGASSEDVRVDSGAQEPSGGQSRNNTEEPAADLGKCPNCGCSEWDEDKDCVKCKHPHGEPVGDEDEPDPAEVAAKTRALCHSLRDKLARHICDYHEFVPNRDEKERLVKLVQGVKLW